MVVGRGSSIFPRILPVINRIRSDARIYTSMLKVSDIYILHVLKLPGVSPPESGVFCRDMSKIRYPLSAANSSSFLEVHRVEESSQVQIVNVAAP